MVDIEAWAKAEAEFGKAEGSSWAWVDDDGNHLGYMTEGKKTLAVRDFLRKKG